MTTPGGTGSESDAGTKGTAAEGKDSHPFPGHTEKIRMTVAIILRSAKNSVFSLCMSKDDSQDTAEAKVSAVFI